MTPPVSSLFINGTPQSREAFHDAIEASREAVAECFAGLERPYSGASPLVLKQLLAQQDATPVQGEALRHVIKRVGESVLRHSAVVSHPACIAHLHCPPLIAAVAAEVLIAASNPSMDSWDQSMAATFVEEEMVRWLCGLFGYDDQSDGVFTSGGTQSNLMGLLLARDHYLDVHLNWPVQQQGLPPEASRLRILCSEAAHFTVRQSAALLGLGQQAVVTVATDADYRMCPRALDDKLAELKAQGLLPFALVATVGTTDFGSVDPLDELHLRAKQHQLWLHVDAAYGGALALSGKHSGKLSGVEQADSITVDFHKLFYQPISCGAFLLKERSRFRFMQLFADYLNPEEEQEDVPNLVTKSLQTTRRFDALKLYMSIQSVGSEAFGQMIDTTITLAARTASHIEGDDAFELLHQPELNAVVFRYVPKVAHSELALRWPKWTDQANWHIRDTLLREGVAVIARTRVAGRCCLKFTLLNPMTTVAHMTDLLEAIKRIGDQYISMEVNNNDEICQTNR